MTNEFRVKFRGVRGSYPVPGMTTNRYGGNTPCVEVQVGGHLIIFDAGTGIIGLGQEVVRDFFRQPAETRGRLHVTIILTHMHHDHIQGYPFFAPLYLPQTKAFVYGPRMLREDLSSALSGSMVAPYFPVDAESLACERTIRNITEADVVVFPRVEDSREPAVMRAVDVTAGSDQVQVHCYHSLNHPRGGVFIYRVSYGGKKLVFATDTEGYAGGDQRLVKFAKDADVLVHDAQYRTEEYLEARQGWGHSTIEMAADIAQQANVKQLILYHHAPTNDDSTIDAIEREAREIFPNSVAAHEGMELSLETAEVAPCLITA